MLITPSQIALYALAGLFALFLWVRVFTFPRGKRRPALNIAVIFLVLMVIIVGTFSFFVPWLISLILRHPFTGFV
jgi:hypothetical protein